MWGALGSHLVLLTSLPPGDQLPDDMGTLSQEEFGGTSLLGLVVPGSRPQVAVRVSFQVFHSRDAGLQSCLMVTRQRNIFGSTSLALALILDLLGP